MQNDIAKSAANWWIEHIKEHCSNRYPNRLTDESFLKKLSHLQELLTLEIDKHIQKKDVFYLGCYYFPTHELSRIAKIANFHYSYFPPDIEMQIKGEDINVSIKDQPPQQLQI